MFFIFNLILLSNLFIYCCKSEDYWSEDYFSDENSEGDFKDVFNVSLKGKPKRIIKSVRKYNHTCESIIQSRLNQATTTAVPTCIYRSDRRNEGSEEDDTLVRYPFSVSIQRKSAHYASGALVSKRWILTSAAEFYNVRESIKLFRARLGSVDCKRGGLLIPIKRLEIHPNYVYRKPDFDLALLRMALPVNYSDVIRPIPLSRITAGVLNAKFLTTYWPRIVIKDQVLPETALERTKYNSMRVSTQKLISWDDCSNVMVTLNETLSNSSLCMKPIRIHHSVCMPDVGAPVIAQDGLWGIISSWISRECPTSPGPTVFTRVSLPVVRSWLDEQLLSL